MPPNHLSLPSPSRLLSRSAAGLGAFLGLLLTGLLSQWWLADLSDIVFLIAPMGASAVLMFAVPASPLAQPWPALGGNIVSGIIGVTCAMLISDLALGGAVAVGSAILVMNLLRCTHPPGGAVALISVVGGGAIRDMGYAFVFGPVAVNSALLLLTAVLFHRISGHSYPHRATVSTSTGPLRAKEQPSSRVGFTREDIANALRAYGDDLDVMPSDLEALFHRVEAEAMRRHDSALTCADIMIREPAHVLPHTKLKDAGQTLLESRQRSLPVLDERGNVLGIVHDRDLLATHLPRTKRSKGFTTLFRVPVSRYAGSIMTTSVPVFAPETPLPVAADALADDTHPTAFVCDTDGRLSGLISRQDVLVALNRETVEEMLAAGR